MSPLYAKVTDITEEYYDKVQAVNLKGPFALSLRLGGYMFDHDGGVILNISTIGSIRTSRNEVVYGMAKSGLNAMTVALADAFGPKVRVNCILPGAILTDISKAWSEETIANAHQTPMGRAGYAEDFPGAPVLRQRGVRVDHRHVPSGRWRGGPPARTLKSTVMCGPALRAERHRGHARTAVFACAPVAGGSRRSVGGG